MKACVSLLLAALLLHAAGPIDPAKVVYLTHSYDANTIYWPTEKGFQWEKEVWGETAGGYFYSSAKFASAEHGGAHFDSPLHFAEGKRSVEQIPVQQLIGPALVVDVATACAKNPDYLISPRDLAAWEAAHGRIPEDSLVLFRNGWSARWPGRKRYMGTGKPATSPDSTFRASPRHRPICCSSAAYAPPASIRPASTTGNRRTFSSTARVTRPESMGSKTSTASTSCRPKAPRASPFP